eukprot:5093514-Pleurochrysis_carterae.AAC.1
MVSSPAAPCHPYEQSSLAKSATAECCCRICICDKFEIVSALTPFSPSLNLGKRSIRRQVSLQDRTGGNGNEIGPEVAY